MKKAKWTGNGLRLETILRFPNAGLIFIHSGGHGVHIHAMTEIDEKTVIGKELDYITVGNQAKNCATINEVRRGIAQYLNDNDL